MKTCFSLLFFCCWIAATAQDRGKQHRTSDAPFLTPEEAVAKMSIPEGFEVSVFVSEPDIGEPIAFTFDGRGRLWVVENYNYVNRRSHKNEELSRIQIFEDTDSDGVFDTKTLFHDELTFASGIAVGFGGVYLGAPPNLVFIPDNDGNDVPDGEPEILLDGWGIQDRHETLNSFLWGPDGWLYGCHGVFTQSLVGKPGAPKEERRFIDAGIWRFHPVRKEFEIFAQGLSNPWGFDFNDVGHGFATCCVIPHLFHIVQGGIYHKQARPNVNPYVYDNIKTIRDHTHLSAHGGARFYLADVFPAEYRDHLFMCNIHEHAVLTDYMEPNGSSYIGRHGHDFIPTHDLAWVGFSMETGPDGGVYVLDWHDTDICGNAINFPRSGRVYRIMPKGAPRIARPNMGERSDGELVALQDHANDWYVRQARVELHHRAMAGVLDQRPVHDALDEMFEKAATPPKRLRALWAQHVTGRFAGENEEDLVVLLGHEDEHVRSWAVQLLSEEGVPGASALMRFAEMAKSDSSPTVRLFLASAMQRLPHEQRWEVLASLAKRSEDREDPNIPRMLWYGLEPMVIEDPRKALATAMGGAMPFLQESVARRMVSGAPADHKKPNQALLRKWHAAVQTVAPGFRVDSAGEGGVVALTSFRNGKAVQTHPASRKRACTLTRNLYIPAGEETRLRARVSYHAHGDWQLRVLAAKEVLLDQVVSYALVKKEWFEVDVDLSKFAGQTIEVALENR
ncbi:MAG: PVC-type heme-binding CxxCH protein, partial [Verrucomicrobiota bacterium]